MEERRKETKPFAINQRSDGMKKIMSGSFNMTVFYRVIKNAKAIKLDKPVE